MVGVLLVALATVLYLTFTGDDGRRAVPPPASSDGFSQADVARLLESTTTRSISASMSFSGCQAMIRRIGTGGSVAPKNIVDTAVMRMARFDMVEGGSLLVTCSQPDRKAVLTRSFE